MKKVLITGGSRGIGSATAKLFLERGYDVFAPKREELNLLDKRSIEEFVQKYSDVTFDVVINNAGINDINLIENLDTAELENMIQVNLVAPMLLLRGVVPNMKTCKSGKIVNIGSIWGVVSKAGRVVYSATKHGIHGITSTLAVELAPYNILVNTINPGFTLTELTKKNNTEDQIAEISSYIPLGRMAEPEEIAKAVYMLCSDYNSYITGQLITVDGGYTSK